MLFAIQDRTGYAFAPLRRATATSAFGTMDITFGASDSEPADDASNRSER
jgi:hypothetical protein